MDVVTAFALGRLLPLIPLTPQNITFTPNNSHPFTHTPHIINKRKRGPRRKPRKRPNRKSKAKKAWEARSREIAVTSPLLTQSDTAAAPTFPPTLPDTPLSPPRNESTKIIVIPETTTEESPYVVKVAEYSHRERAVWQIDTRDPRYDVYFGLESTGTSRNLPPTSNISQTSVETNVNPMKSRREKNDLVFVKTVDLYQPISTPPRPVTPDYPPITQKHIQAIVSRAPSPYIPQIKILPNLENQNQAIVSRAPSPYTPQIKILPNLENQNQVIIPRAPSPYIPQAKIFPNLHTHSLNYIPTPKSELEKNTKKQIKTENTRKTKTVPTQNNEEPVVAQKKIRKQHSRMESDFGMILEEKKKHLKAVFATNTVTKKKKARVELYRLPERNVRVELQRLPEEKVHNHKSSPPTSNDKVKQTENCRNEGKRKNTQEKKQGKTKKRKGDKKKAESFIK